ncbi:hypothetical protein C8R43DRAFT_1140037 [Mycena crocata]|nr:hypothetical protein C8R43DRAFT_1140037 [Mycena crocata]
MVASEPSPSQSQPVVASEPTVLQSYDKYNDISHERSFKPPLKDNTWFLLSIGLVSRDRQHLFKAMEERFVDPEPGFEASDYPTFAAPTFKSIIAFLPRCPPLEKNFERQQDGGMKQIENVYCVIHGLRWVFSEPLSALRMLEAHNDPLAIIIITPDRESAEKLSKEYPAINRVTGRPAPVA